MARTKKPSKINSLTQTHAKVEASKPTSLDEIWGFNPLSRYQTFNESEYESNLKEMTRADLENHARAVGSIIVEDSERIRKELMKLFRAYISSLKKPTPLSTSNLKLTPDAKKVLNEGR